MIHPDIAFKEEIMSARDLDLNLRAFKKGVELAGDKVAVPASAKTRKRK